MTNTSLIFCHAVEFRQPQSNPITGQPDLLHH